MGIVRKPCIGCGGPKEPGERRRYCDACKASGVPGKRQASAQKVRHRRWRATRQEHLRAYWQAKRDDEQWWAEQCARRKAWRKANLKRERKRQRNSNRSRRSRNRAAFVEFVDETLLYWHDQGKCGICGRFVSPTKFEVDHVIPIALGGMHSYDNVQIAHRRCNRKKGARLPEELIA